MLVVFKVLEVFLSIPNGLLWLVVVKSVYDAELLLLAYSMLRLAIVKPYSEISSRLA